MTTEEARVPRQITRLEERLKVDRRTLEYLLQGSELEHSLLNSTCVDSSVGTLAAPRWMQDGVHVFQRIANHHGITSVGVDPNFKIGARSKKGTLA